MDRLCPETERKNARFFLGLAKEGAGGENLPLRFRKKAKKGEKTIYRVFSGGIFPALSGKGYIYGEHMSICRKQEFE